MNGLADIDIKSLVEFHYAHNGLATISAVKPPGRYGAIEINNEQKVDFFKEKPDGDGSWINGGFYPKSQSY